MTDAARTGNPEVTTGDAPDDGAVGAVGAVGDLAPVRPPVEPAGARSPTDVGGAVAEAHRRDWGFVLAATVRVAGDIDLAEECVQEAYVAALTTWTRDGVPANPAAWLTTAARRKAVDHHRRQRTLRSKLPMLVDPGAATAGGTGSPVAAGTSPADEGADVIADDRLRLVFTCCHPALAREAQIALTLRLVCGLSTAEIAQAFLVPEATLAARVTRAKKKIAAARIPYRVPEASELPDRLDAVLTVVHLLFTTGHTAPAGARLVRSDLVDRAVALARTLLALMPDEREVRGLLALLLFADARRDARADSAGRLVLLEDQDRSRWDRAMTTEALELLDQARRGGRPGRFALQAAVAAVHAESPTWANTDWNRLVARYDDLLAAWPSPVVELNRSVALAMAAGPEAGLAAMDDIAARGQLGSYRYLHAARADLLRRLGRRGEAAAAYQAALDLAQNDTEREFLAGRLAQVTAPWAAG